MIKEEQHYERDDFHYFITGYTSGGASYGITWEEAEAEGLLYDQNISNDFKTDEKGPEIREVEDDDRPF